MAARGSSPIESAPTEKLADREIVLSRVLDAPRERVWDAVTDPAKVVKWWGPHGFTTTIHEMDLRPGGVWRHTMRGPDGRDYPNKSIFREVVRPERLVYAHGWDAPGEFREMFEATWALEAQGAKTTLTLRMVFPSAAERDHVVKEFGAVEGGKQTMSRLAAHLAGDFMISRLVDAPRERVWKAWTEAERLKAWFGPKGFETFHATLDLRPGGFYHYGMRAPNGTEMWGKWTFREIAAPERLSFVSAFSDKEGGLGRHPLAPEWPQQFLSTVLFADFGGKTLVTVMWGPHEATESEIKIFREGFSSMTQGWTGTFERLDANLKAV